MNIQVYIGFEGFIDNQWTTEGQTGDLSQKEALTLFGTIYKLVRNIKFYSISLRTPEHKKGILYFRMLHALKKKLASGEVVQDNEWLYLYSDKPLNTPHRPKRVEFIWKYRNK